MTKHIIRDSARKKIMDQKSIFGSDICEQLAEILTNADDSYNRMEEGYKNPIPKKIDIYVDRILSELIVVDNAEGMSKDTMIRIFEEYDSDTSGSKENNNVRGMFGRGATDVLLESARIGKDNSMISIKNNKASELKFNFDQETGEKYFVENALSDEEISKLREKYNIKENGTIVRFGTDLVIHKKLAEKLADYYMLQFLFSSPFRDITLYDGKEILKPKKDMDYFDECDLLIDEKIKIKYKNFSLEAILKIVHNKNKNNKQGILIYDEKHAVYDDTCFGRERDAGMNEVEGRLEIVGLTNMLKHFLTEEKERIVTATRDGFDIRHPFYIELKKKIEGYLIAACNKVTNNASKNVVSLKDNKEWKKVFKDINKYFQDELGELIDGGTNGVNTPPQEGLLFKKQHIPIKQEKFYGITLLINPFLIKPGSLINIECDDQYIELQSKKFIVPEPKNDISSVLIGITGRELTDSQQVLVAKSGEYEAKLYYEVKDEEIHLPSYGMDFYPSTLTKKPDVERNANIYVDIDKFPLGTEIKLINTDNEITLPFTSVIVEQKHLVSSNIAKIEIPIAGGILDNTYFVEATAKSRNVELTIKIKLTEEDTTGKSGIINDIQPRKSPIDYAQSYYIKEEKIVVIVSNNIINSILLEKWLKSDGSEFATPSERYYFYNVLSEELARIMVNQKKEKDKIQLSSDSDQLINILSEEKDKIFKKLLDSMGA